MESFLETCSMLMTLRSSLADCGASNSTTEVATRRILLLVRLYFSPPASMVMQTGYSVRSRQLQPNWTKRTISRERTERNEPHHRISDLRRESGLPALSTQNLH